MNPLLSLLLQNFNVQLLKPRDHIFCVFIFANDVLHLIFVMDL